MLMLAFIFLLSFILSPHLLSIFPACIRLPLFDRPIRLVPSMSIWHVLTSLAPSLAILSHLHLDNLHSFVLYSPLSFPLMPAGITVNPISCNSLFFSWFASLYFRFFFFYLLSLIPALARSAFAAPSHPIFAVSIDRRRSASSSPTTTIPPDSSLSSQKAKIPVSQ